MGVILITSLIVGLRHEVGADWFHYADHIDAARLDPWTFALGGTDPAYSLITAFGAAWGGDHLVNSICAVVFCWGLAGFCRAQPHPWLALAVAVPYLVVVVAMGYTRQGVALGLVMVAMVALANGYIWRFTQAAIAAALFHKTAVILILLAVFSGSTALWFRILLIPIVASGMFIALLQDSVDFLVNGYLLAEYDSAGAAVRITMNAFPAAIFLLWRKRFQLNPNEQQFWTNMSLVALLTIPILIFSPSSTAVDRMAVYWIPLQLYVWSRVPLAFSGKSSVFRAWTALVLVYSAAVLLVWLLFADHAFAWLPYRFYPFVWLGDVL